MRIALGTVQFGLDYGVSNQTGVVGDGELDAILVKARHAGIDTLDTAQAYGHAERRLGAHNTTDFKVISKLAPGIEAANVAIALENSLEQLARPHLEGLLLHRSQDATPLLLEQLITLQKRGLVDKIGVSVYSPQELELWLTDGYPLQLVQLPANLLDQRFLRSGWLDRLQAMGCEIHVRSLFLQGLLLMQSQMRPDYFCQFNAYLNRLDNWHPHISPLVKALSIMTHLPQVHRFVIGICHVHELAAILAALSHLPNWESKELASLACDDNALINPSVWRVS